MSHAVTACAEKVLWAASNPGLIDKLGYHLCGPPLLTDVANDYVTAWGRKLADFHRTEGETIGNVKILPITAFVSARNYLLPEVILCADFHLDNPTDLDTVAMGSRRSRSRRPGEFCLPQEHVHLESRV